MTSIASKITHLASKTIPLPENKKKPGLKALSLKDFSIQVGKTKRLIGKESAKMLKASPEYATAKTLAKGGQYAGKFLKKKMQSAGEGAKNFTNSLTGKTKKDIKEIALIKELLQNGPDQEASSNNDEMPTILKTSFWKKLTGDHRKKEQDLSEIKSMFD